MNEASINRKQTFLTGFILVFITFVLYWPITGHQFLTFDDHDYVTENRQVTQGLTLTGVKWAFTSFRADNWHPLTWISHMLDWSIYGPFAGGHLSTNMLLHSLNTLLVFLVLKRMTGDVWPSALVAALFGWHPLHVESVAWVSERKDVLSTFFMLLILGAYVRYTEKPSTGRYLAVLLLFVLGLMSKPMLVTLPCVLLLLDYWPLRRAPWPKLVLEKLPLFALSAGACVVTLRAQRGAIDSLQHVSLSLRIWNSFSAYGHYLLHTIWPTGLCVFYPLPTQPAVLTGVISAVALVAISGLAWIARARWPWALMGWLWFLGTLVPVIGLVQVGSQAMADRYTYVPLVGLFVAVVWSVAGWLAGRSWGWNMGGGVATVLLLGCLLTTHRQIDFWQDSVTLFTRAVAVTRQNGNAEDSLGRALVGMGRGRAAVPHFLAAVRINPDDVFPRYDLGFEFIAEGKYAEAEYQCAEALKRNPESQLLHNKLGEALALQGRLIPAMEQFQEALRINPAFGDAYLGLGTALEKHGDDEAALTNFQKAVALQPPSPEALDKLAMLLVTARETNIYNPAAALKLSRHGNELGGYQSASHLDTLALTLAATGDYSNAVFIAQEACKLALAQTNAALAAKLEAEAKAYRAGSLPAQP